jgi:hypothetical protein
MRTVPAKRASLARMGRRLLFTNGARSARKMGFKKLLQSSNFRIRMSEAGHSRDPITFL